MWNAFVAMNDLHSSERPSLAIMLSIRDWLKHLIASKSFSNALRFEVAVSQSATWIKRALNIFDFSHFTFDMTAQRF